MKKYATEIKWGLIFTIVALLWMVFERLMGWHGENIAQHSDESFRDSGYRYLCVSSFGQKKE